MAKRRKNRLDMYAETRIWNLKLKNRRMATDALKKEMIDRFKLEDTVALYPKLRKVIYSARRRVLHRQAVMRKNIKTWSHMLCLPEKIVAGWAVRGLLTKDNIEAIAEVLETYRELIGAGSV